MFTYLLSYNIFRPSIWLSSGWKHKYLLEKYAMEEAFPSPLA